MVAQDGRRRRGDEDGIRNGRKEDKKRTYCMWSGGQQVGGGDGEVAGSCFPLAVSR